MKKNGIAVLIIGNRENAADIEYATGFKTIVPVPFLRNGLDNHLIVPALEHGHALQKSVNTTVHTPESLKARKGRMNEAILMLLRRQNITRIGVSGSFPLAVGDFLRKRGVRLQLLNDTPFPERAVKNADEIRKITESQQAAVIAMRKAVELISRSETDLMGYLRVKGRILTSEQVRNLIQKTLLEHNCACAELIVSCGEQAANPHERGHGPLRARETIVIDIFPQQLDHGYWGDLTRTVVRGHAPAEIKSMYHAVRAAQSAALGVLKAGVKGSTVHNAAVREFRNRNYETKEVENRKLGFIHSTGHGVGLMIHEAPVLGAFGHKLKTGNVVTVEPGLYYPGIGGIRVEDTVLVTETGWKYLVPCEKKLEV